MRTPSEQCQGALEHVSDRRNAPIMSWRPTQRPVVHVPAEPVNGSINGSRQHFAVVVGGPQGWGSTPGLGIDPSGC